MQMSHPNFLLLKAHWEKGKVEAESDYDLFCRLIITAGFVNISPRININKLVPFSAAAFLSFFFFFQESSCEHGDRKAG